MNRKITRRRAVALAAVAAAPAGAQQAPPIPSTPEDERKAALAQFKSGAGAIAKVALPMATEPAVHFKA